MGGTRDTMEARCRVEQALPGSKEAGCPGAGAWLAVRLRSEYPLPMAMIFDRPLAEIAEALRRREVSATELTEETIRRHEATESSLAAYKHWDPRGARDAARGADERLRVESEPPPFCGVPVSVKDLYGVEGLPTFAGTARRLPRLWETDAWLIHRLRSQGAIFTGKTHTVELAYGAVGVNPHWDTPWNPWTPRSLASPAARRAAPA